VPANDHEHLGFDGRVVIVTGAGNDPSLGRAYARLFAQRGARVVVNDFGVGSDGRGRKRADAVAVAEQITAEGGIAVADTNSVAEQESAAAIVRTALDAFGRVDVLINNAGVVNHAPFDVLSDNDIRRMVDVHLMGSVWVTRAAWPVMKANGYGRIVNITSGAMFGLPHVSAYGAAKGGLFGLARNLAVEGAPHGIKVNALSPSGGGASVMTFNDEQTEWTKMMNERQRPELVAPAVALLAHERCPCSGKTFEVAGGRVQEIFFARSAGYDNVDITVEDLLANWDLVTDRDHPFWYADNVEYAIPPWVTRPYSPS
jgi:NAD(P)-dependent dehydrogenase (short-subunit alcohol dehydrogenase family)